MSKKKPKPHDVAVLAKELAKISTMANTNYNPAIDAARVEAAELIVKHYTDEKAIVAARDVLVEIISEGAILPQHRVRAIKVLLENNRIFATIDAVYEQDAKSKESES